MCLLALAGCSSGGNPIVDAALERFTGEDDAPTATGAPAPANAPRRSAGITRAAIEATGTAMIRGRLVEENSRSVLSGVTVNGPYVTYASRFGQLLTLNGSLITGSRGIGTDLLSLTPGANDPLVRARPVASWPATIRRTYRVPGPGPGGRAITVTCRYQPGETREIEIVEVIHKGQQVEEICSGDDVSFTNVHFADAENGFVWRSLQWLGPDQGFIDLEVLEPFTSD
ncbi:YjbF family lipoprotein [Oceanibium sediminis]|uniref:YjbF family lipoprotein n=1 Tax=Oceanibium sediminis TaxID=2026339 RepID=UPI000DD408B2|nr:YjbF family lipoprotein [Oceanibium sediminis]